MCPDPGSFEPRGQLFWIGRVLQPPGDGPMEPVGLNNGVPEWIVALCHKASISFSAYECMKWGWLGSGRGEWEEMRTMTCERTAVGQQWQDYCVSDASENLNPRARGEWVGMGTRNDDHARALRL
eukprot:7943955-Pyramimonas_sp.AAC.1